MSERPLHIKLIRRLRRFNSRPSTTEAYAPAPAFDEARLRGAEAALRELPCAGEEERLYLEKHIPRLAQTLALVPPPQATGRVLELGCYMQITPLLERFCGYTEVRGAYYGPLGRTDHKRMWFPGGAFHCDVDHFDAERDPFPYPDGSFDLVVAGEIIEHMVYDPMHLLLESHRVLAEGGFLLVSTPNIAGLESVFKVLHGRDNPQIYPQYKQPDNEPEIGHVREYTMWELGEAVKAAGFEIARLFTTVIPEYQGSWRGPLLATLDELDYPIAERGEQTWCLAIKRTGLPVDRYPWFIYY